MPVNTRSQAKKISIEKNFAEISNKKVKGFNDDIVTWLHVYCSDMIFILDENTARDDRLRLMNELFYTIDQYYCDVLIASKNNSTKFKSWVKFGKTIYNKAVELQESLHQQDIKHNEFQHFMNLKTGIVSFRKNMIETFKKFDFRVSFVDYIVNEKYNQIIDDIENKGNCVDLKIFKCL